MWWRCGCCCCCWCVLSLSLISVFSGQIKERGLSTTYDPLLSPSFDLQSKWKAGLCDEREKWIENTKHTLRKQKSRLRYWKRKGWAACKKGIISETVLIATTLQLKSWSGWQRRWVCFRVVCLSVSTDCYSNNDNTLAKRPKFLLHNQQQRPLITVQIYFNQVQVHFTMRLWMNGQWLMMGGYLWAGQ